MSDLAVAEHLADALLRVAFARAHERQQHLGVFHRILTRMQPWLPARFGLANRSCLVRVVLIDQEFVGEIEAQPAERVLLAGRLRDVDGAVADCSRRRAPSAPRSSGPAASTGIYSLATIEGGTFQVGLTVMDFISALMIGVGVVGLPVDDPRHPHLLAVAA